MKTRVDWKDLVIAFYDSEDANRDALETALKHPSGDLTRYFVLAKERTGAARYAAEIAINDMGDDASFEELYDHGIGIFHAKLDGLLDD